MNRDPVRRGRLSDWLRSAFALVLLLGVLAAAQAGPFTLSVVDQNGASVPEFRWLLQEDTTIEIIPGVTDALSKGFHRSYAPVVAKGDQATAAITPPDPAKRYYLSVLPQAGFTMSGAAILPATTGTVTVKVHSHPIPTAQISVSIFEDNYPINNAHDQPQERGLPGFKIRLEDAGGRYGVSAGSQMMDAFGHPIGTVYGQDGHVVKMGDGVVTSDANGNALIQNLAPGKYSAIVTPPAGQGWHQTSTIEGTRVIDAWVKANEPPFFVEFGPPGVHIFVGFVKEMRDPGFFTGSSTITGRVVNMHSSRPPNFAFWPGHPIPGAWVGLNSATAGTGRGVYAAPCNDDSTFSIANVPPGTYELVVWDDNLDVIFAFKNVTVPASGTLALGDVAVFNWFGRLENTVFEDQDGDGFRDPGEPGISDQLVNIRWRDGSLYQSMATDTDGEAPLEEVFPFFNWLVAEVDYTRYKATGLTAIVDAGGEVKPDLGWAWPSRGVLNPQPQAAVNPNTGNNLSRTETGPVLTQAFQLFLGQTNVIEWGKQPYGPGENGGISGIVHYATTRAEHDPRLAVAEPWEPGIPRVQVNLYRDADHNLTIDDPEGDGVVLADVDNHPLGWAEGGTRGSEDVDRNLNGTWDQGDAVQVTWTDSWDDNLPSGAQGDNGPGFEGLDAFDGMRNFNQVRPGVFDGGYAFNDIPAGTYIVEAAAPPGYEHVKEEDKNVDFGDAYTGAFIPVNGNPVMPGDPPDNPAPGEDTLDNQAIPAGDWRTVPAKLSLFPTIDAPFAGELRRLPDRKQVQLADGLNAACNFFLFTEVPVAGHIVGIILDDTANEFDPTAPAFGEKFSPPFLPISIRDWEGNLISWTVSDRYGAYNALVPSTYTTNLPQPSGMSPNMLTVVLNDPGHPTAPANPKYSQFSYTFQYMPGTTTYLDTPVLPIAAFAGPDQFPVDVEYPNNTPVISHVEGGPYVAAPGAAITIRSLGTAVQVPNPDWDGTTATPRTVTRNYGFGGLGPNSRVTIGGVPLNNVTWRPGFITGTVAPGTRTGQLVVTRNNGLSSQLGLTVTVGPLGTGPTGLQRQVIPVSAGQSIQAAIEAANPGDLILVGPGTYDELVIMTKPVQLQGWGAGVTFINAVQVPAEKILGWRTEIARLWTAGAFDLLPAQAVNFLGLEPALAAVEGAGISVFAPDRAPADGGFGPDPRARIDGFTIEGASTGGGIFVNGYAHYLEISNNRLRLNSAAQGGAVTLGHPDLALDTADGLVYQSAHNDHVRIHNNQIAGNGGLGGAGGGVSLYTGADYYEVTDNLIAGNFTMGNGGGIGHLGRSENGTIARNSIVFNQSFNQGLEVSGGGLFIGGHAPLVGTTPGSGPVHVDGNLIQGNLAGAGDGGGIRTQNNLPGDLIAIVNNLIVNNVAGLAGGGISMQDTANILIHHDTVAHNDSTATAGAAFLTPNESTPQVAGIVAREHTSAFKALTGAGFSNPSLDSTIVWQNRSFYFFIDPVDPLIFGLRPDPAAPVFSDLGVTAPTGALNPVNCLLTGGADPGFRAPYFNGPKNPTIVQPEFTTIQSMPAFDEGGNFIDVRFGPLTTEGSDYHVAARIAGGTAGLTDTDLDGELSLNIRYIGADRPVGGRNQPPAAVNDAYAILLPASGIPDPLVVNAAEGLLANDFDPDGNGLTVRTTPVSSPAIGTLALNPDGSFTYTPGQRFEGVVTFSYLVQDGPVAGSGASVGTVTITVSDTSGNQPPVPTAQPLVTMVNTPGSTRVMPNDPDIGDTHTFAVQQAPQHGTATVSASGSVIYTPNENFTGEDSLVVQVTDQSGLGAGVTVDISVSLDLPPTQELAVQLPPDTDGIDTDGDGDPANDHIYLLLGAGDGFATMADGYPQYMFGFHDLSGLLPAVGPTDPPVRYLPLDEIMHHGMLAGEWPAPTIKVKEGQKLYLNLVNVGMHMRPDLFDPHSVHWHGFPQAASVFDGVPDASISINMMGNFTYFYNVVQPGTYLYHCHVEATEHMQMGMLGNLYVTPLQDNQLALYPKADGTLYKGFAYNDGDGSTGYDLDVPLQIGGFDPNFHDASLTVQPLPFALMEDKYPMINGRGYPDTLEAGSLPPVQTNAYGEGLVAAAPAPGTASFHVSGLEAIGDTYKGLDIIFTSGALKGVSRMIAGYNVQPSPGGTLLEIVLDMPLPEAPAAGDVFTIGKVSQRIGSRIEATPGQRILLRLSSVDVTRYYTLASTLPMHVVGHNARLLRGPDGQDLSYTTQSVTLGGGEALDALIDTTGVAPGTYLLYTANLNYLSNHREDLGGMMTEIVIRP